MKFVLFLAILMGLLVSHGEGGWWADWKAKAAARREARQAKIRAALEKVKEVAEKIGDAIPITLALDEEEIQEFVAEIVEKAGDISEDLDCSAAKLKEKVVDQLEAFKDFVDKLLILLPKVRAAVQDKIAAIATILQTKLEAIYYLKGNLVSQMKEELSEWKVSAKAKIKTWRKKLKLKLAELEELTDDAKEDCEDDIDELKEKISTLKADIIEKVGTAKEIALPIIKVALAKLEVVVDASVDMICDCAQDELDGAQDVVCDAADAMLYDAVGIKVQNAVAEMVCDIRDNIKEAQEEAEKIVIFANPEQWSQPQPAFNYKPQQPIQPQPSDNYVLHISHWTLIMTLIISTSCAAIGTVLYCKQKRQNSVYVDTEYKM